MEMRNAEPQGKGFRFSFVSVVSFVLLLNLLWLLGNAGQVHACKCVVPGSPSEELAKSSTVFAGRAVLIQHTYDPSAATFSPEDRTTIGFIVSAVWKGVVYEKMYITTPPTGGSCGFTFEEGEEYIVYAHDSASGDGGYTVSICSRTALLRQAQADIDALGEGDAPRAGTGGPVPEQEVGYVRDGDLGQTYVVVRRSGDGQVVRRWIAPDSPLGFAVPWSVVDTLHTFPVEKILGIPLDDRMPWPNQLVRRFDGGDDRILAYDAELGQWRHVPDIATFQARGYYWCNVTAADAGFFDRITLGPPYPASSVLPRADYPVCQP